jgi:hypothetical protein
MIQGSIFLQNTFSRLIKNVPACAEPSAGRQMQVELDQIPRLGQSMNCPTYTPQWLALLDRKRTVVF